MDKLLVLFIKTFSCPLLLTLLSTNATYHLIYWFVPPLFHILSDNAHFSYIFPKPPGFVCLSRYIAFCCIQYSLLGIRFLPLNFATKKSLSYPQLQRFNPFLVRLHCRHCFFAGFHHITSVQPSPLHSFTLNSKLTFLVNLSRHRSLTIDTSD